MSGVLLVPAPIPTFRGKVSSTDIMGIMGENVTTVYASTEERDLVRVCAALCFTSQSPFGQEACVSLEPCPVIAVKVC